MPHTETLTFESARTLHALCAGDEANLRMVEKALKIKLASRDTHLKIQGKEEGIETAKEFFRQLQAARLRGVVIRRHEFRYILEAVKSGQAQKLDALWSARIHIPSRRAPVAPRTFLQRDYLEAIDQNDLVFGLGCAGTGKTYLAVAKAVEALKQEKVERIVLTRPAVEAGEALGFLPGVFQEKLMPYLRPLYDALNDILGIEAVERYTERGVLEIAPLAYMRGRTLENAFIILDEAQNTTTEQMFMLLTRLGVGSKCVVTGDPTQVDLPHRQKSGLAEAAQALSGVPGVALIRFQEMDIVRHELVADIILAYKEYRGARQTSAGL
ncbi:MAG: PhoH family protein [bacterium]